MNIQYSLTIALAKRFMEEVLAAVETLAGISEQHGVPTLVDLVYLQNAIICRSFIDHDPDSRSKIAEFVKTLPSSDLWLSFIRQARSPVKAKPLRPLALQTGITLINESTTPDQAREWLEELETLYNTYFDDEVGGPAWTWPDCHETDHYAFLELSEVVRSASHPPIDSDQLSFFRSAVWRHEARQIHTQVATA